MTESAATSLNLPSTIHACLFDMDGVLTQTAKVHAAAWKEMFDGFLQDYAHQHDIPFVPFDIGTEYVKYVDGRLREDGVRIFLESRGISLPEGNEDDPESAETIHGLGNRKNARVVELIRTDGVETYPDAVAFLEWVRKKGIKTAVVSASKNTPDVLRVTGLTDKFDYVMHGGIAGERGLPGKPEPDTFLAAAAELGEEPANCAVLEDAIAGVEAGRDGHFGFVIGVDRVNQGEALCAAGATVVTTNLEEFMN